MEPEGTLSTSHRESRAVKRKPAPRPLADKARAVVDSVSQHGTIIRQRLDIEKLRQPLQKGTFYVAQNEGQAESGFLVFLPGSAVVFVSTKPRAPPPCMLRMRVSPYVAEGGGSILVASLDSVQHTLRLEDVWQWRGERIFDMKPYSERRKALREFCEKYWIPDARLLGGIQATVLNPMSLEEGLKCEAHTLELIPEQAGRRRLWIATEAAPKATAVRQEHAPKPEEKVQAAPITTHTRGWAKPIDSMPDIYDVYDDAGTLITRASVQRFSTSQALRTATPGPKGVAVRLEWRAEFNGYEIVGLSA